MAKKIYDPFRQEAIERSIFESRLKFDSEIIENIRLVPITFTSYSIEPNTTQINEGESITFNIETAEVPDGTTLYWTLNGTVSAADFLEGITSGSLTITSNSASFTLNAVNDLTTEGTETFTASLRTNSITGPEVAISNTVTIIDTSVPPVPSGYLITFVGSPRLSSTMIIGTGFGAKKPSGSVNTMWSSSQLYDKIDEMKVPLIRYPGGTDQNYWDWQNGTFVAGYNTGVVVTPWATLDFYCPLATTLGLETLWCLNVLSRTPVDQRTFLNEVNSTYGQNVDLVEMGNEWYLSNVDEVTKYPTGADYGLDMINWLAVLRDPIQGFPSAKYAVVGSIPAGASSSRRSQWNTQMIGVYTDPVLNPTNVIPDAVTLHSYNSVKATDFANIETWLVTEVNDEYNRVLLGIDDIYDNFGPAGSAVEIWITEYNIIDDYSQISGTWAHGLYNLVLGFKFLLNDDITMVLIQTIYSGRQFSSIFHVPYAFGALTSTPFDYSATGLLRSFFGPAFDNCDSYQALDMPSANVYGMAFLDASSPVGDQFILVNLERTNYSVDLTTILSGRTISSVRELWAEPDTYVNYVNPDLSKVFPNEANLVNISNPSTYTLRGFQVSYIVCV